MTEFSNHFFPPKNPALSRTTPHWPLTPCIVSGKNNELMWRKLPDGRMEG